MLFIEHFECSHVIFVESFVKNTDGTVGEISREQDVVQRVIVDCSSLTSLVSRSVISDRIRDNTERVS